MKKIIIQFFNSLKLILNDPLHSIQQIRGISKENKPVMTIGEMIITYCFGKMALSTWIGISVVKQIPNDILPKYIPKNMPPGMTVLVDNLAFWLIDGFLNASYIGIFAGLYAVGPYFYLKTYKDKTLKLNLMDSFCWVYYFALIISFFASILSAVLLNVFIGLRLTGIISTDIANNIILLTASLPMYITYSVALLFILLIYKYSSDINIFYVSGLLIAPIFSYFTLPCIFFGKIKRFAAFLIDIFVYISGFGAAIIIYVPYKILSKYWQKSIKNIPKK